jgi:hypothetical protein
VRFQVHTGMKIQVVVFWVVTSCSDVGSLRWHGPPKHWYPTASLYSITTHKSTTCIQEFGEKTFELCHADTDRNTVLLLIICHR